MCQLLGVTRSGYYGYQRREGIEIDYYREELLEAVKDIAEATDAGLDFGEQIEDEEEFLHLDTLLSRYCEEALNMHVYEAKQHLRAAVA